MRKLEDSNEFKDADGAEKAKARIRSLTDLDLDAFFDKSFADCPNPDRALINLERWLTATANPDSLLRHLAALPGLAAMLVTLLGASQPVADALILNPELASVILDSEELHRSPTCDSLLRDGRLLMSQATTYSHALDRIRYLKQRWTISIVVNDLTGGWEPEHVWRALSDLADAILELTLEASWKEFAGQKSLDIACPIMVVAFGKLGGHELNYSSDVDLVYVLKDDVDEALEKLVGRFCEMFGRALSDRMGRGSLYRVDLRLRPFGGAGPIAPTMRAVEAYYRSHAQGWESQALLRSRPVAGLMAMAPRWAELVKSQCFRPSVSEMFVQETVDMRERIEEYSDHSDLKRGPGGIRDVEFLTQVLQMIHGYRHPAIQEPQTCEALRALNAAEILDKAEAESLIEAYRFLRQLEHRCQLVDDQQTHSLPSEPEQRESLARIAGYGDWQHLVAQLEIHRFNARALYNRILRGREPHIDTRAKLAQELGASGAALVTWFDRLPEPDGFYRILEENEGSLERIRQLFDRAPAVAPVFRESLALTEALLSGEIEEEYDAGRSIGQLKIDATPDQVAKAFRNAWVAECVRWSFHSEGDLSSRLTGLFDLLLKHVCRRLYANFDLVALGTYACNDLSVSSDADIVLLVRDSGSHQESETQAQHVLAFLGQLKRHGAPANIDLRLRPEGGQGLLVRSYEGLRSYELERMEMWERFALGHARLIYGDPESAQILLKAAYAVPLTPERLKELVAMKGRIETERVAPQYRKRHVKLGFGGLSDIEWFVHLHEMRFPTATEAGLTPNTVNRIKRLCSAGLINTVEMEELLTARTHLLATRNRLALLGRMDDVVPENPDRLDHLARVSGFTEGNKFLAYHTQVIETVRAIYLEGLERLRA